MQLKIILLLLVVFTANAGIKPNNNTQQYYPPGIVVDSSGDQSTLITTAHECVSYDPVNDALVIVNRGYVPTGILFAHSAPGDLSFWINDLVYNEELGHALSPSALAGDSGPYISFPYTINGAYGGGGGIFCSGGWYSSNWDAPVDLGPGDQKTQICVAKQCVNGNVVFLLYSYDPWGIMYRTYNRDLSTLLGQGWLTPTPRYYWGWDYNKTAGIGYLIYSDAFGYDANLFYRTTTDGIIWSAEQIYDLIWPDPWPGREILHSAWGKQMAVTDVGNPVLVFALYDSADVTYPPISRVYVSTGSGQPCVQVSSSFGAADTEAYYCTIATGGTRVAVVYVTPRNNLGDSLCWTDIYYTQSDDDGVTWTTPENLTITNNIMRTSFPQLSKRLNVNSNRAYLVYGTSLDLSRNIDLAYAYLAAIPVPTYIHLLALDYGVNEIKTSVPTQSELFINPNPACAYAEITFQISVAGNIQVSVYSIDGRLVRILENGIKASGWHKINMDAKDLANGTYLVLLESKTNLLSTPLVVVH